MTTQTNIQEMAATRDGFGVGIVEAAQNNPLIYALCADLTESMRLEKFEKLFPERFVQTGVAEQNMIGVAAGLALAGKIPFAASFAVFSPGRSWDQIRVSVAYSNLNVKIVGGHAGLDTGPDGATHQALEDIAMMKVLPNMIVIEPCDAQQAREATLALASYQGPAYLRLSRPKYPVLTHNGEFKIGKAETLLEGNDLTLISSGSSVHDCLEAAAILRKRGVKVKLINMHTIKPIDKKAIIKVANQTKNIITVEDHQINGGLGSSVAQVIAQELNRSIDPEVKFAMIGVSNFFGESGSKVELKKKYKIDSQSIVSQVISLFR